MVCAFTLKEIDILHCENESDQSKKKIDDFGQYSCKYEFLLVTSFVAFPLIAYNRLKGSRLYQNSSKWVQRFQRNIS